VIVLLVQNIDGITSTVYWWYFSIEYWRCY